MVPEPVENTGDPENASLAVQAGAGEIRKRPDNESGTGRVSPAGAAGGADSEYGRGILFLPPVCLPGFPARLLRFF